MSDKSHDEINSPSHYVDGRKYEPLGVIIDWNLGFLLGNVVKYISRYKKKGGMKDLRKAQFYLDYAINKPWVHSGKIRGNVS